MNKFKYIYSFIIDLLILFEWTLEHSMWMAASHHFTKLHLKLKFVDFSICTTAISRYLFSITKSFVTAPAIDTPPHRGIRLPTMGVPGGLCYQSRCGHNAGSGDSSILVTDRLYWNEMKLNSYVMIFYLKDVCNNFHLLIPKKTLDSCRVFTDMRHLCASSAGTHWPRISASED